MKAITLWQPYASFVALGVKTIETRSWRAPAALIGQRLAIHASAKRPKTRRVGDWNIGHNPHSHPNLAPVGYNAWKSDAPSVHLTLGAVVATAIIEACIPMVSPAAFDPRCATDQLFVTGGRLERWSLRAGQWRCVAEFSSEWPYGEFASGRWAWFLTDVEPCEPVAARGAQRIWEWKR